MGVEARVAGTDVERPVLSAFDGALERRLEAAGVEDEVGVPQALDVARGRLEVVWLDTGGRQVRHTHLGTADLLGGVRERVEAGDDVRAPVVGLARAPHGKQAGGDEDENDSRPHGRRA